MVLSVPLLPMINSFIILFNMSFHNLLACCPCLRQVRGLEVATHQRLLTFGRDFASRSILRPKYHILDDLFSILKGVVGEGALQCIHLVLVLLVGCAAEHVRRS